MLFLYIKVNQVKSLKNIFCTSVLTFENMERETVFMLKILFMSKLQSIQINQVFLYILMHLNVEIGKTSHSRISLL